MKQLPGQANCSGESLLHCDVKHTHTSAYLELKPQLTWLCSPSPVLLKSSWKSLLEKNRYFLPFRSCISLKLGVGRISLLSLSEKHRYLYFILVLNGTNPYNLKGVTVQIFKNIILPLCLFI